MPRRPARSARRADTRARRCRRPRNGALSRPGYTGDGDGGAGDRRFPRDVSDDVATKIGSIGCRPIEQICASMMTRNIGAKSGCARPCAALEERVGWPFDERSRAGVLRARTSRTQARQTIVTHPDGKHERGSRADDRLGCRRSAVRSTRRRSDPSTASPARSRAAPPGTCVATSAIAEVEKPANTPASPRRPEHFPRRRAEAGEPHREARRDRRAPHHLLAADAVADAAPNRREHRRRQRTCRKGSRPPKIRRCSSGRRRCLPRNCGKNGDRDVVLRRHRRLDAHHQRERPLPRRVDG